MHSYKSSGLKARNISRARKPVQRPNSSRGEGRRGACVREKIPPCPPASGGESRLVLGRREDPPLPPPQAGGSGFGVAFARGCYGLSALPSWVYAVFLGLHPRL